MNPTNKIFLFVKNIFGTELLYPTSGASEWEQVTSRKTFNRPLCDSLTQLGFKIVVHDKGETISYQTFFERINQ